MITKYLLNHISVQLSSFHVTVKNIHVIDAPEFFTNKQEVLR